MFVILIEISNYIGIIFIYFRPEITILSAQPMISDLIPPPLIPLPTVNVNKIIIMHIVIK